MSSYRDCKDYEERVNAEILSSVEEFLNGRKLTVEHITDLAEQRTLGDIRILGRKVKGGAMLVDIKSERESSLNMFYETASNMAFPPRGMTSGWGMVLKADRVWYHFEDIDVMPVIDLAELRGWLLKWNPVRKRYPFLGYPERPQAKNPQKNLTVGRLIPFVDMPEAAFWSGFVIHDGTAELVGRKEILSRLKPRPQR